MKAPRLTDCLGALCILAWCGWAVVVVLCRIVTCQTTLSNEARVINEQTD